MNLFVLHTPLQLLTAQLLVAQRSWHCETENVLCFEGMVPDGLLDRTLWSDVIMVGFHGSVREAKATIEETHSRLSQLVRLVSTRVFISDVAWPLNNRLFFSPDFRACEFNIVSDGIASYIAPRISFVQHLRNVIKFGTGLLGLTSRYRPYVGDLMGTSQQRIAGIYCFKAELLSGLYRAPVHDIEFGHTIAEVEADTCLFLDQPCGMYVPAHDWAFLRQQTLDFLRGQNIGKIYYKPHPLSEQNDISDFQWPKVEIVNTTLPAEIVQLSIRASTVISYTSTALFNIKVLAGSRVRAIALFPDYLAKFDGSGGKSKRTLAEVFSAVGVEVVPYDGRGGL